MPTFYSYGTHSCLAQRPPVNSAFRHVYAYPPIILLLHMNIPELYGIMDDLTLEQPESKPFMNKNHVHASQLACYLSNFSSPLSNTNCSTLPPTFLSG